VMALALPGTGKFKIFGLCDDTPHADAYSPHWKKPGNLNFEEQEKTCLLMTLTDLNPFKSTNLQNPIMLDKHPPPNKPLCSGLYTYPSVHVPGLKFLKISTLLTMSKLCKHQDLLADTFVDTCTYAVSHRWESITHPDPDGQNLARLKKILYFSKANQDAGIFIDYCCLPQEPLNTPVEKAGMLFGLQQMSSLYERVHIIFLLSPDYFSRSWCWYECTQWLLSRYPTQGICDCVGFFNTLAAISLSVFQRPPFVLDRPELLYLGQLWLVNTKATCGSDTSMISAMMTERRFSHHINSCPLTKSLTNIVFKLESIITVL